MSSVRQLSDMPGQELATVSFVRDYVELGFDGPILTCFAWPTIAGPNGMLNIADDGYRDALCSLIDQRVTAVLETAADVTLWFSTFSLVVARKYSGAGPIVASLMPYGSDLTDEEKVSWEWENET